MVLPRLVDLETISYTTGLQQAPSDWQLWNKYPSSSFFKWPLNHSVILSDTPLSVYREASSASCPRWSQSGLNVPFQVQLLQFSSIRNLFFFLKILHFVILSSNKTLDKILVKSLAKLALWAPAGSGKQHKLTWFSQRGRASSAEPPQRPAPVTAKNTRSWIKTLTQHKILSSSATTKWTKDRTNQKSPNT